MLMPLLLQWRGRQRGGSRGTRRGRGICSSNPLPPHRMAVLLLLDTDLANKSDVIVSPRSGHDPKCSEVDSAQDSVVGKKCNKDNNSQSLSSLHETSAERKRQKKRERHKRRKNNTNISAVQTPLQPGAGDVGLTTTTDGDNTPGSECKKSKKRQKKNRTCITEAPLVQRMDLGETASIGMMGGEVQSAFPGAGDVGLVTTTDGDNTPGSECKKSKKRQKKNRTGVTEAPLVQRMDLGETASIGMMGGEVQSAFPGAGDVGLVTTTDGDNTPGSECKKSKKRQKKNRTGVTEAPLVQRMDLGETASIGMMGGEVQSAFSEEESIKSSNNVGSSICASEEIAASSVSLTLVQDIACNTEAKADCQHAMSDKSNDLLNLGHAHKEKIQDIYSPRGSVIRFQRKKLLILDINGLLVDINQDHHNAHMSHGKVRGKLVFKRPYYYDFLKFCFQNFELGIWSSRMKTNVESVVNIIMKDLKPYLLFCWDLSKCTRTGCKTLENKNKPLVLKELKKLWNKEDPDLPWEQGEYSPSNTLLVDDSPYKALANPPYTAIFPQPYRYHNKKDDSLGPGGDLRVYLENLATADDIQCYVQEHPFGQPSITKSDKHWNFYAKILDKLEKPFA
ncbi:hypothetical protein GUJ93_ZPchr0007g5555 [Zizania palustris]|uniref:FCP1 homology domain-containing protein n=1 Tax=Zizania palustris TaxID=103762 RepID=A0A8J5W002_ZIZPA|nr:hypothetical protein GUJ93_ZPchr0007g5555 [Zizania palustris]